MHSFVHQQGEHTRLGWVVGQGCGGYVVESKGWLVEDELQPEKAWEGKRKGKKRFHRECYFNEVCHTLVMMWPLTTVKVPISNVYSSLHNHSMIRKGCRGYLLDRRGNNDLMEVLEQKCKSKGKHNSRAMLFLISG